MTEEGHAPTTAQSCTPTSQLYDTIHKLRKKSGQEMESQNRKVAEEVEKSYRLLPCVAYNASVGQSATAED
ncbi:unnamed protein product [Ceratitis capitata]|uniref:(Mediterranean fruit fly) hypothetical protein n=1 Tax=Ceratitis capitata TaxID=7213 RepID=A0A811V029_CERCA|nr:unnamed protein product [Ceratitis capitata]